MPQRTDAAARRYLTRRPTGKIDRHPPDEDRAAIRQLWSLLYRAVRRDAQRVNYALRSVGALARRIGSMSTQLTALTSRVEALERRVYGSPSPTPRRPGGEDAV